MGMRKEFMQELLSKLLKHKNDIGVNEIMSFCEDILVYLEEDEDAEYETNQQHVGMKELFRGYVIRDWMGINFSTKKYRHVNKIIASECVYFYDRCWKHRNEAQHDESKQKERMKRWYEKEKDRGLRSNMRQIRMHVDKCKIDENRCNSDACKRWIMNLKAIEKKVEKIPENDVRRFMML